MRSPDNDPQHTLHHQLWTAEARPAHEVLASLLEELEDLMAGFNGASPDCSTTPLVTPPDDERDGAGEAAAAVAAAVEARDDGGGARHAGGGADGKRKGLSLVETEAFVRWSNRTGELQNVPPLESVDLPGEKGFTEGCLKVGEVFLGCVCRVVVFQPQVRKHDARTPWRNSSPL